MKIEGHVHPGKHRGRTLGFPTINIPLSSEDKKKEYGVYSAIVKFDDKSFKGVANFGAKPTFKDPVPLLEVHILNFEGDLLGKRVEVELKKKIRDIKKFKDESELVKQIKKDCHVSDSLDSQ